MSIKLWKICFCKLLFCTFLQAQSSIIDSSYFQSPVKHKTVITGSFGELRANHFHAGIDFRSSHGPKRDSLFAAASGYLSRIKVQASSYGQSLYLDHDNGYTSVYAHLHEYAPKIEYHLKKKQYELEMSHIDYYLDSTSVFIKKGEFIGIMGNTGRSSGPHLHFEIRETASEIPVNPYAFNLKPEDHKKPILKSLFLHKLDSTGHYLDRKYLGVKDKKGYKTSHTEIIEIDADYIGIALGTFDQMDGVSNLNGTYQMNVSVNGKQRFDFTLDKVSFEETRYINAVIDYPYKKTIGNSVIRLYKLPGNLLTNYTRNPDPGIIPLSHKVDSLDIILRDFEGNTQDIKLYVKKSEQSTSDQPPPNSIRYDSSYHIANGNLSLHIPQFAFDQDIQLNLYAQGFQKIQIGKPTIPVYKYLSLQLISDKLTNKHFIGRKKANGRIANYGGYVSNDTLKTQLRTLGDFSIYKDETPPTVRKISMSKSSKTWSFAISDNIDAAGICPDIYIRCTVDGQWIRHFYDKKHKKIIVKDIDLLPKNARKISIRTVDPLLNRQITDFII